MYYLEHIYTGSEKSIISIRNYYILFKNIKTEEDYFIDII